MSFLISFIFTFTFSLWNIHIEYLLMSVQYTMLQNLPVMSCVGHHLFMAYLSAHE